MQDIKSILRQFLAILFKLTKAFLWPYVSYMVRKLLMWELISCGLAEFLFFSERLRNLMTAWDSNEGYISKCVLSRMRGRNMCWWYKVICQLSKWEISYIRCMFTFSASYIAPCLSYFPRLRSSSWRIRPFILRPLYYRYDCYFYYKTLHLHFKLF